MIDVYVWSVFFFAVGGSACLELLIVNRPHLRAGQSWGGGGLWHCVIPPKSDIVDLTGYIGMVMSTKVNFYHTCCAYILIMMAFLHCILLLWFLFQKPLSISVKSHSPGAGKGFVTTGNERHFCIRHFYFKQRYTWHVPALHLGYGLRPIKCLLYVHLYGAMARLQDAHCLLPYQIS